MKKSNATKLTAAVLAAAMLISGGSYAYRIADTETVTNEFDYKVFELDLKETVDPEFEIDPGQTDTKDPYFTLTSDTNCYVFMKVDDQTYVDLGDGKIISLVDYALAAGWSQLYEEDGETAVDGIFYFANEDGSIETWQPGTYSIQILDGDQVSYPEYDLSNEEKVIISQADIYLAFQGWGIESAPFEETSNAAYKAWKAISEKVPDESEDPGPDPNEVPVVTDDNKVVEETVLENEDGTSAVVQPGTELEEGVSTLSLKVTSLESSESGIEPEEDWNLEAVDVHIEGVSENNTVPILVDLGDTLDQNLNLTSVVLYHVEDGQTNAMEAVRLNEELESHNQYQYDPETGDLKLALTSFSEVTILINQADPWEGTFDSSWYSEGEETYTIRTAEHLASFAKLVTSENTFADKTVYLAANIDLSSTKREEDPTFFYPIGYWSEQDGKDYGTFCGSFEGTFDGMGHTVTGLKQEGWDMNGSYTDNGYYKAAFGLFGDVYDGTIKNLTVDNFYLKMEYGVMGNVAAFTGGTSTFENIRVTNCDISTYNTFEGGVVGYQWTKTGGEAAQLTFKNITVDDTNYVRSLWGSWDVGAGGILGYLSETGKADFINVNSSATLDVYNDVCGAYQYYWYRYCGMIIGTVDRTITVDGVKNLDMTGITADNYKVNFGDRMEYYYCEFEKNGKASYSGDYKFSRISNEDLVYDESGKVTGCKHEHIEEEDHRAVYLPFRQLFGGYSWGVKGVQNYTGLDIVTDKETGTKFDIVPINQDKYLYRIGNSNSIKVSDLFTQKAGESISQSGVYVTIDSLDPDCDVKGTWTANETDWTAGTIQFTGTGPVEVTIQDYDYCEPAKVLLEIVDGKNISAGETISSFSSAYNSVLLGDVTIASGGKVSVNGVTLYGNGYTFDVSNGTVEGKNVSSNYLVNLSNGILDNVKITGAVYTSYGVTTSEDYNNPLVLSTGTSAIYNSDLANCVAPVYLRNGTLSIYDSVLRGGCYSNLIAKNGKLNLHNVTTINQSDLNDKTDDGEITVGLGIVTSAVSGLDAPVISITGSFNQLNSVTESDISYIRVSQAVKFASNAFENDNICFTENGTKYVNTGIVSLSSSSEKECISDLSDKGYEWYTLVSPTLIYTPKRMITDGANDALQLQGVIEPELTLDNSKNYQAITEGSNDYCIVENDEVKISMDSGDTFSWNPEVYSAQKNNKSIEVTSIWNDRIMTESQTIEFSESGTYSVIYKYTDPNNYKIENGQVILYSKDYEVELTIVVVVVEPDVQHAEFNFGSDNIQSEVSLINDAYYVTPVSGTNVEEVSFTDDDGSHTVNCIVVETTTDKYTDYANEITNDYVYLVPVFKNVVSITDYDSAGNAVTYNSTTMAMPEQLILTGYKFSSSGKFSAATDITQVFKYGSGSNSSAEPVTTLNSSKLDALYYRSGAYDHTKAHTGYIEYIKYGYTDNAGRTYYYIVKYVFPDLAAESSCITPETLITLSDNTQVKVQDLTGEEELLVFNHMTGKLDSAPVSVILNHDGNESEHEVLTISIDDGYKIEIIGHHVFFDADLMKYVEVDLENIDDYIGHNFLVLRDGKLEEEKFTGYTKETRVTGVYEVVSDRYLTCFTNNILSAPGGFDVLLNVFDLDENTYKVNTLSAIRDLMKYGLYTYEDFSLYITEEVFHDYNAAYLKIAVGKGWITFDDILTFIENYGQYAAL